MSVVFSVDITPKRSRINRAARDGGGMADTEVLKTSALTGVWVRVPPILHSHIRLPPMPTATVGILDGEKATTT
jgi:hypothetical protein